MKNIPLLIGTLVGTVALIVGVAIFFSHSSSQKQTVDQSKLTQGATHTIGGGTSPKVTVVEFSDLQCPACKAVEPLMQQLRTTYADRVQLVFRHYPLVTIHPYAMLAAQAAEAAGQQGKFWEMHDLLYSRQEDWASLKSEAEVKAKFIEYAQELTIDKQKFTETIQSDTVKTVIAQDMALGTQIGVDSTPTIYINGQVTAPQLVVTTVESLVKAK